MSSTTTRLYITLILLTTGTSFREKRQMNPQHHYESVFKPGGWREEGGEEHWTGRRVKETEEEV